MKKEGKVWIKISGDFATFLKFRSWKRSNIKSKDIKSGQIRSNTSKHIPKGENQGIRFVEKEKNYIKIPLYNIKI